MIKAKIKHKKKTLNIDVPERWEECKLKHIVNLDLWEGDNTDVIGLMACFVDLPQEVLEATNTNLWDELFKILSFVFDPPTWHNLKRPDKIEINGRYIKVPNNLELESFGQKVMAMQKMVADQDSIKVIPDILAIYLQPVYDGKFSRPRIEVLKEYILECKAIDTVPIGRFFFRKLLRPKRFGLLGLNKYQRILKQMQSSGRQVVRG